MATQITPLEEVRQNLSRMEGDFKSILLPYNIEPSKFNAVVITALQLNPALLQCDRASLFNACRQCAQEGLVADGRQAALVPFGNKVQYMSMAAGLVMKLNEAGVSVNPQIVHKNDKFRYWTDELGQHLNHEPDVFGDRGEIVGVYNISKTSDGTAHIEVMSKQEVEDVRKQSKQSGGLMWTNFWGEAAKKTIIRRSYKWLPKTAKTEELIKKYDKDFEFTDADIKEPQTTSSRLTEAIAPAVAPAQAVQHQVVEEAVVTSSVTTPFNPTPEAKEQPYVNNDAKTAYGLIEKLDIKHSPEGSAKKWTKFGCKIGDVWYATFSETLYKKIAEFADNKILVAVKYTSKVVGDKTYHEVVDLEAQVVKDELPI